MFQTINARMKLATHLWGARRDFRVIRRRSNYITRERYHQLRSQEEWVKSAKVRNPAGVITSLDNFFKSVEREVRYLKDIAELAVFIQSKILNDLRKLDQNLRMLLNDNSLSEEGKKDFALLQETVHEIRAKIILEKKQARDIRFNRDRLRDNSLFSEEGMRDIIRRAARRGQRDNSREHRELKNAIRILKELNEHVPEKDFRKAEHMKKQKLRQLNGELIAIKSNLIEEVNFLSQIFKAHIVLTERLESRMEENFTKSREFMRSFPHLFGRFIKHMEEEQKEFMAKIKENEQLLNVEERVEGWKIDDLKAV